MVSPSGKLHARRASTPATCCGLKFHGRHWGQVGSGGWVQMAGDFEVYLAKADGRTCKQCQENLRLGTGPGA